ncbi:MAG: PadR family transcriptional regulator [Candidatus Omnitrophica bacterium]|nr:PadR family transcriptional regulator [Candidatus Omnitrophota bacterium]
MRNLEFDGLVTSNWEIVSSSPVRRVYKITEDGKNIQKIGIKEKILKKEMSNM